MTERRNQRRDAPFSLRLSFAERSDLKQRAGDMPLSAYMKSLLFAEDAPIYRKRRNAPQVDEKKLAEVLACLGASRIGNNLNQLAKAANTGSLPVDDDTTKKLHQACDDVRLIRLFLMEALGKKIEEPRPDESTSQCFARAARKPTASEMDRQRHFTP